MSTTTPKVKSPRKTKARGEAALGYRDPTSPGALVAEEDKRASALAAQVEAATVSGYYEEQAPNRGEMRLDVDGTTPQMTVSGLIASGLADRLHWIAKISPTTAPDHWVGEIWFKEGAATLLPHTKVEVALTQASEPQQVTLRFSKDGLAPVVRVYRRKSAYFHPVEFEFDVVQGTTAVTQIDTHAHPNRPAGLPSETLTIETAFRRAGFDVSTSSGGGLVPLPLAGADQVWSDTEMHDAMQIYWSRFANKAQWSLWVLFAARHETGRNLGGVMFDSIGPNHRQGTAIFNDSFIAVAPDGDAAPVAWVQRMKFWTACHEMGHAFNLAHSWQKALGTQWIPIHDEPEARSFMNYPYNVTNGQTAFFADFPYRFSEQELMFMRHAPERFVQMGNADWFDHHAFEQAETSPEPAFRVELRLNRPSPILEFLEPCVLEIKLTNVLDEPQLVREQLLRDSERMVVIIKRDRQPARQWLPFAHYCYKSSKVVLEPRASRYESLFVGAGRNGWDLSEPGLYTVQVVLRISNVDYVSNPLRIRVKPPRSYEEENLAQDFFTEDVGRVLAFDGSRALGNANDVLRAAADQFADRAVAHHALVALGRPLMTDGKVLAMAAQPQTDLNSAASAGATIERAKAKPNEGQKELMAALMEKPDKAAETLGHIDYKGYADEFSETLAADGNNKGAADVQDALHSTLAARKVAASVLTEIKQKRARLAKG
jgi:hypothetical protein